ncbi:eukaryotic translation initiation factor 5-like [Oscarella lobularis]|uniref:eukaryotic translation initiation factor 5-like n=1 Tax=Oscarella lobularis TaxID=121494 RepID=UPI00331351C1
MAAMVNVDRKNTDPYYRYKMPRLLAKVEGKGNGIKTVVVNMVEIAKSLSRPPSYPCKYFGCELGAQTQMDAKNERYIVNGAHEGERLQELLDGFIKKFVMCNECENPETILTVDKRGNINQGCSACGHQCMIDPRHRLTTFIVKNPPSGSQPTGKKGSKEKKAAAAKEKEKEKEKVKASGHKSSKKEEEDVEWSVDTSEEAVKQRMGELSAGVKTLAVDEGSGNLNSSERVDAFFKFVHQKNVNGLLVKDIGAIVQEAKRLDVFEKAPLVLAELLFDKNVQKQIKEYRAVFLRFVNGNKRAQKYLLGAFEQLVGRVNPELKPRSPYILKEFYEQDLLEEEVILEWDQKVSKRFVDKKIAEEIHQKAAPFVKWLREAEEGSSSEEEGDVEVVYSTKPQVNSVEENDEDGGDDGGGIDIDAI